MPLIFPINFRESGCVPCQTCMKISLGHDESSTGNARKDGVFDYYGCVGEIVCSLCNRNICQLHSKEVKEKIYMCVDCK